MLKTICAVMLLGASAFAQSLTFATQDKVLSQLDMNSLEKLSPSQRITIWDPHEKQNVTYEGFLTSKLLEKVLDKNVLAKFDTVYFTCSDGFKAPISLKELKGKDGFLAFKKYDADGKEIKFTINNKSQNEKDVDLSPFYLVWKNKRDTSLWPYQVVRIELRNDKELFKKLSPAHPSAAATRGLKLFKQYCILCHKVQGVGGDKGGELVSSHILDQRKDAWLNSWIDNPSATNPQTTMPSFNPNLANRKKAIRDIVSYLRSF